ncbi:MAG: alkaline phosphatase [Leptospiraceae bacterium]|nr:alkaline phosphatase [Leptospiraceae bacterium]
MPARDRTPTFRIRTQHTPGLLCLFLASLISGCDKPSEPDLPYGNQQVDGIILILGDGMGLSFITQASLEKGEPLAIEGMPVVGLQRTKSLDGSITDSAAAITAIVTGHKTFNGWIGLDGKGNHVRTLFEEAKQRGWNTAVISTSSVTHATPAGAFVHVVDRKQDEAIAWQLAHNPPDILIGGGRQFFAPRNSDSGPSDPTMNSTSQERPSDPGMNHISRTNESKVPMDLLRNTHSLEFSYVRFMKSDCDSLCVNGESVDRLIALLADDHLPPVAGWDSLEPNEDGKKYHGAAPDDPPTREGFLRLASVRTVRTLLESGKPFLMLVEGSQIDWGGHGKDIRYALRELYDLDETVAALRQEIRGHNILIIFTADHETGGHAILDGKPGQKQKAAFLTNYHTAVMVPVFAAGPGSEQFTGTYENTDLHHKMLAVMNAFALSSSRITDPGGRQNRTRLSESR